MAQTACLAAAAQMLISWSKPVLRKPLLQSGFTLLELLVAMVIISLMTAVVGFSVSGNSQRTLKGEGDKLAARLNAAHAQMNAGASPLRLVARNGNVDGNVDGKGDDKNQSSYAFETTTRANDGSATASWKPVTGDDVLAPRALPTGSALRLSEPLLIAREPVTAPVSIVLEQGDVRVRIATDGINGWAAQ